MTEDPTPKDESVISGETADVALSATEESPVVAKDWREAAQNIGALEAGDVITGFQKIDDLDLFANNVGRFLKGHDPDLNPPTEGLTSRGRWSYYGWHASARRPSDVIAPKTGQLKNIKLVMLDDQWVDHTDGILTPDLIKSFVIASDLYVTGVGIRGKVLKKCTISLSGSGSSYGGGDTTARYKNLPGHNAEVAAEALLGESQHRSDEVIRNGLRHVFSAGLPGHGKRR